jgi:hypothetical protein
MSAPTICADLRGGAGRTRTGNHAVMRPFLIVRENLELDPSTDVLCALSRQFERNDLDFVPLLEGV